MQNTCCNKPGRILVTNQAEYLLQTRQNTCNKPGRVLVTNQAEYLLQTRQNTCIKPGKVLKKKQITDYYFQKGKSTCNRIK